MDKIRKVKFSLAQPGLSIMDYGDEADEKLKERDGLFHIFGNEPFWDANEGKYRDRIVGVVEEVSTGKIYEVYPEMVQFVN